MIQKSSFKNYKIEFSKPAQKDLKKLDKKIVQRVHEVLQKLVNGDQNVDLKKLVNQDNRYRIRIGQYRIIFEAHKHIITIVVVSVDTRENVYKDM